MDAHIMAVCTVGSFVDPDPRRPRDHPPRLKGDPMGPTARLIARAVIAAVLSLLAQLEASDTWDGALLRSAIAGAILAALEYLTPLNQTVGPGKPDS